MHPAAGEVDGYRSFKPDMALLSRLFWNSNEHRLRAGWRLTVYLLLVAVIAIPLILLLDATDNRLLEASLKNLCAATGFGLALVVSARYIERRSLKHYGLGLQRVWWVELGIGLVAGGIIMAIAFAVLYLAGWVVVTGTLRTTLPTSTFALAFVGQFTRYLSGSFFEEVMSRGYLLRMCAECVHRAGFQRATAVLMAALATAALFGLLHLFNPGASVLSIVNLIILGLLFAMPMLVTGRLALSIGLHAGWNVFQNNVFGLPNGGKPSTTSLLVTQDVGPAIWTGGAIGPEGGLIGSGTILLGLVVVGGWLWVRNRMLRWELSLADPPQRAIAQEPLE